MEENYDVSEKTTTNPTQQNSTVLNDDLALSQKDFENQNPNKDQLEIKENDYSAPIISSATLAGEVIPKNLLDKMSEKIKFCSFCKKMFVRKYDLRKHYCSCSILEGEMNSINKEKIPEEILNDVFTFKEKKAVKRKLKQVENGGSTAKCIKTDLETLKITPLAFYPCFKCVKPCDSLESLTDHLREFHDIETEQQGETAPPMNSAALNELQE